MQTSALPLSSFLFEAAATGNTEVIREFIESGGDVNSRNLFQSQLLHVAAREGQVEVARLLIDSGANVNSLDYAGMRRTALHWACQQGHVEMVELLVDSGADTKVWCSLDRNEQVRLRKAIVTCYFAQGFRQNEWQRWLFGTALLPPPPSAPQWRILGEPKT
uniref:Ankyrin repeat domain 2 (Stretch responsive muscle) n=1 Tax=Tetraselmis sp. GSL018 TaxID=582737 RepID=A0A061QT68_9CHLO|mmetsp:Transcript_11899/g.28255  ORF Transcript_11899/g.28255 Transcript_11899/m.28255 type:complete len:162 (+) Transcript_11899:73-558(+)